MSDKRIEQVIGALLRVGVLLSAAVVLAGGIWLLIQSGGRSPHYQTFRPLEDALGTPLGVLASLLHPNPHELIQFGLLLLIATPVARVVVSLAAFAVQRDRVYVVVALIVLAVLAYSLAVPLLSWTGLLACLADRIQVPSVTPN
jgi:uncharacterized membrane protein